MKINKSRLPKATRTEELNRTSQRRFEELFCIGSGFHITKIPLESDKGIDYIVNLINKDGGVLPDKFIVQLKSTHQVTCKDSKILAKGFPVKTINLLKDDTLPAYVFFYVLKTDTMYWGELNNLLDILRQKDIKWHDQKETTLYFDVQNLVSKDSTRKIYNDTKYFCSQLSEIKTNQELIKSLLPYCEVNVEYSEKGRNININPIKNGIAGRFSFKYEDYEKLKTSQSKGIPCSLPLDNGRFTLTHENKEICTIDKIQTIQLLPNKTTIPIEVLIPDANISAGTFSFLPQNRGNSFIFCSEKKHLPWYIQLTGDAQTRKSDIKFKFYPEFSDIEGYLKYLKFMESLSKHKKLIFRSTNIGDQCARFDFDACHNVESWEIAFFENLFNIEKYANKKFTIPTTVTKEDAENAYILSELFLHGEVYLPNIKLSFSMLGSHLKNQIAELSHKETEIASCLNWCVELCGEILKYDMKIILENALPDNTTVELFNHPNEICDEIEYSFSYIAQKKSCAKITFNK
jgi:hypothetical protein